MSSRRTAILIAAIVIAAIAAVSSFYYLSSVQDRANKGAKLAQVYVVSKPIPKGLPGKRAVDEGYISASKIQADFRPDTALTDLAPIRNKVALTDLAPKSVVVAGQFVEPRVAQTTFSQNVHSGYVAVTVSVDAVHGVGSNLLPGDLVDVLVQSGGGSGGAAAAGQPTSERLLYQNVRVLAIGQSAAPQPGQAAPTPAAVAQGSGLITFEVPAVAAQKIILASQGSGIYLALVPPDNVPAPVPPANVDNLNQTPLTPCDEPAGDKSADVCKG